MSSICESKSPQTYRKKGKHQIFVIQVKDGGRMKEDFKKKYCNKSKT